LPKNPIFRPASHISLLPLPINASRRRQADYLPGTLGEKPTASLFPHELAGKQIPCLGPCPQLSRAEWLAGKTCEKLENYLASQQKSLEKCNRLHRMIAVMQSPADNGWLTRIIRDVGRIANPSMNQGRISNPSYNSVS
jgi:hypothetical protein